jgi:hypothetical protein
MTHLSQPLASGHKGLSTFFGGHQRTATNIAEDVIPATVSKREYVQRNIQVVCLRSQQPLRKETLTQTNRHLLLLSHLAVTLHRLQQK